MQNQRIYHYFNIFVFFSCLSKFCAPAMVDKGKMPNRSQKTVPLYAY
jgi:hypothetical protein